MDAPRRKVVNRGEVRLPRNNTTARALESLRAGFALERPGDPVALASRREV